MAAFKAGAERPALPGLLEDDLFRVPFEWIPWAGSLKIE
jgi:hypothetical protein